MQSVCLSTLTATGSHWQRSTTQMVCAPPSATAGTHSIDCREREGGKEAVREEGPVRYIGSHQDTDGLQVALVFLSPSNQLEAPRSPHRCHRQTRAIRASVVVMTSAVRSRPSAVNASTFIPLCLQVPTFQSLPDRAHSAFTLFPLSKVKGTLTFGRQARIHALTLSSSIWPSRHQGATRCHWLDVQVQRR